MMFWLFRRACRKYHFSYVLSNVSGVKLVLRPHCTFENINLEVQYYDEYRKLFRKAIKTMKEYNNTHKR
jgi:hypothetical protein